MVKSKIMVVTGLFILLSLVWLDQAKASPWKEAGLGVASVLSSSIYTPAKVTYAAVGSVTGGVAWIATGGNTEFAKSIWHPAVAGDYLITPKVLRGDNSSSSR